MIIRCVWQVEHDGGPESIAEFGQAGLELMQITLESALKLEPNTTDRCRLLCLIYSFIGFPFVGNCAHVPGFDWDHLHGEGGSLIVGASVDCFSCEPTALTAAFLQRRSEVMTTTACIYA